MLIPLTQNLSLNDTPALAIKDLKEGNIIIKKETVQRWKSQLLDEDILELNKYTQLLKLLNYQIYDLKHL